MNMKHTESQQAWTALHICHSSGNNSKESRGGRPSPLNHKRGSPWMTHRPTTVSSSPSISRMRSLKMSNRTTSMWTVRAKRRCRSHLRWVAPAAISTRVTLARRPSSIRLWPWAVHREDRARTSRWKSQAPVVSYLQLKGSKSKGLPAATRIKGCWGSRKKESKFLNKLQI